MKDVMVLGKTGDLVHESGSNGSLTLRLIDPKTGKDLLPRLTHAENVGNQYVGPTYRGLITRDDGVEQEIDWLVHYN